MKALAGTLAFAFGTWSALSICWALTGSLAVGITCAILGAFCFGRFCDWCEVTADDCWDVALGWVKTNLTHNRLVFTMLIGAMLCIGLCLPAIASGGGIASVGRDSMQVSPIVSHARDRVTGAWNMKHHWVNGVWYYLTFISRESYDNFVKLGCIGTLAAAGITIWGINRPPAQMKQISDVWAGYQGWITVSVVIGVAIIGFLRINWLRVKSLQDEKSHKPQKRGSDIDGFRRRMESAQTVWALYQTAQHSRDSNVFSSKKPNRLLLLDPRQVEILRDIAGQHWQNAEGLSLAIKEATKLALDNNIEVRWYKNRLGFNLVFFNPNAEKDAEFIHEIIREQKLPAERPLWELKRSDDPDLYDGWRETYERIWNSSAEPDKSILPAAPIPSASASA